MNNFQEFPRLRTFFKNLDSFKNIFLEFFGKCFSMYKNNFKDYKALWIFKDVFFAFFKDRIKNKNVTKSLISHGVLVTYSQQSYIIRSF